MVEIIWKHKEFVKTSVEPTMVLAGVEKTRTYHFGNGLRTDSLERSVHGRR